MTINTLPGLDISWSAVSPDFDETFIQYNIYRRETGTTPWTLLVVITDIETTSYTDYLTANGVSYDYYMTWNATIGQTTLESSPSSTVTDSVTFSGIGAFLHLYTDPTNYTQFGDVRVSNTTEQNLTPINIWGNQKPTYHVGPMFQTKTTLSSVLKWGQDNDRLAALSTLQQAQSSHGSVVVFRSSIGEIRYVNITNRQEQMRAGQIVQVSLTMGEADFTVGS